MCEIILIFEPVALAGDDALIAPLPFCSASEAISAILVEAIVENICVVK